jgi:tripartite-type tricarboxylate transporter receptor subunit TctC
VGDLLAGHVKSAFLGPTALIAHHKAGAIRIIGQSSARRAPTLPDIPTLEEAGYKGLVLEAWYAAFAPANTPADIVAQANAAINKALTDPKLKENFEKGSMEPTGGPPDALGKIAHADSEKYARLVKELGITAAL